MNRVYQTQNNLNNFTRVPNKVQKKLRRHASFHFVKATVNGRPSFKQQQLRRRRIATVPTDRCISGARDNFPSAPMLADSEQTLRTLTLLSTRRVLLLHIAAGVSPAGAELNMSMVPYQEVQSTSQTPCVGSRAGSQPGSNAPPAGLL